MIDPIAGKRPRGGIRANRKYGEGRVCQKRGCDTMLSRYNRREFCSIHAPLRYPRTRGRTAVS